MPEKEIKVIDLKFSLEPVINNAVSDLGENYSLLVVAHSKGCQGIARAFIDFFVNNKSLDGIYLSTNRPFEKAMASLKDGLSFDEKKLFFIDCVGEHGANPERAIIAPAQDLSELGFSIKHAVQCRAKTGFFILDSLSTLFIYNDEKGVEKFTRDLVEKLCAKKIRVIVLAAKTSSNEPAIEAVSLFFDKVLQLDE